jgi:hypothetical protein
MRTIALGALLSLTACAGFPLGENFGVTRLTVRELSALESIPGGYGPTERRSYLPRRIEMAFVPSDVGPGLTVRETVALESVVGAYGPVDKRDEVRRGAALSLFGSVRSPRVDIRTVAAIEGMPRSAFGF